MNEKFIELLQALNITISEKQLKQFDIYYKLLVEWNYKFNLTAITDKEEVYLKHFYDSLCIVKAHNLQNQSILDVGSGAGFPSIPLKIIFPKLKITIIDSLNKRIVFLRELIQKLKIDVELIHGRAEDLKRHNQYDIVTARAVAPLNILTELCLPYVKVGGYFLPLKSQNFSEEVKTITKTLTTLGGKIKDEIEYSFEDNTRVIPKILKIRETALKYPRAYAK
ncbi:MAG: 16S rRNA (guanine(527)-N(7))-methyltransferase RsmG, partial [Bacillota bacterium]